MLFLLGFFMLLLSMVIINMKIKELYSWSEILDKEEQEKKDIYTE